MTIDVIFNTIRTLAPSTFTRMEGATLAEIDALERVVGAPLPPAHVRFLQRMGRSLGDIELMSDYDFDIRAILEDLREYDEYVPLRIWSPLAVATGDAPDYISLSLREGPGRDDPLVYYSYQGNASIHARRILDKALSRFLAWRLLDQAVIARQKYYLSLTSVVTTRFVTLSRVINADHEARTTLLALGGRPIFDDPALHSFAFPDGYVCYHRCPGLYRFDLLIGSSGRDLGKRVQDAVSARLKIDLRPDP